MPSSTSNSDQTTKSQWLTSPWGRVWLATLTLTLGMVLGWEGYWRYKGYVPTIKDDWDMWAAVRRQANREGAQAVALIGASRIQLGLHPDAFEAATGIRPLMLAIDGSSPLPILADLAADPRFTGSVICSLLPQWLADGNTTTSRAHKWTRKYRKQRWSSRVETQLRVWIQKIAAFRYPGLAPQRLWAHWTDGQPLKKVYAPMRPDRFRPADYGAIDIAGLQAARIQRQRQLVAKAQPLDAVSFQARVDEINIRVRQIEAKGGRVVFIRMPSTGVIRELEKTTWPRRRYWDPFAEQMPGPAIHFADVPGLRQFDCPDGSHLDVRDAGPFTRNFVAHLQKNDFRFP